MVKRRTARFAVLMVIAGFTVRAAEEWSGRYVDVADMEAMARHVEERLAGEADAASFHQFRTLCLAFRAQKNYARPFVDVVLDVLITAPGGTIFRVPAFYDGGGTWKVRYMPAQKGRYHYKTICNAVADAGLHEKSGSFTVAGPATGNDLAKHGGHLQVSDSKRFLTFSDGTPFFWLSDTYWFVPTGNMPYDSSSNPHFKSMYQLCVALRKKQGFNALTIGFLGDRPELRAGMDSGARSIHGKEDLWGVEQWTEQALGFWQKADRYILYANEAGCVVTMNLIWANDFLSFVQSGRTREQVIEMVKPVHRYVMARLGSYAILWHVTAEYNHGDNIKAGLEAAHLQVGRYLREIDPYKDRPMTIFSWPGHMAGAEDAFAEDWYQLRLAQGGHFRAPWQAASYQWLLEWYNHKRVMPLLVGEHNFERIYEKKDDAGDVRAAAWRGMMCGSCGYTYGATGLWYPNRDENDKAMKSWGNVAWWHALDYPGAAHMTVMRHFFAQYRWWDLQPCMDLLSVVPAPLSDHAMPTACRLGDTLLLIYIPGALDRDAGLFLQSQKARRRCSFFNPRNGVSTECVTLSKAQTADALIRLPQRPDELDWVIVLE